MKSIFGLVLIVACSLYVRAAFADIQCDSGDLNDFEKQACSSIDAGRKLVELNTRTYAFLKTDHNKYYQCPTPEIYIPALIEYENSILAEEREACELSWVGGTENSGMGGVDGPSECLLGGNEAVLKVMNDSGITPDNCDLPSINELMAEKTVPQVKPGFDCNKATLNIEKTICGNKDIARYDAYVSLLYREAIGRGIDVDKIKRAQRGFLDSRKSACDFIKTKRDFEGCVLNQYIERAQELEGYIRPIAGDTPDG